MCRAFLLYGNSEDKYPYVLNYMVNSVNKGNSHGYFLMIGDKINMRTMSFMDMYDFMESNKELINSEKLIMGHARFSTNTICERNIHGWHINGFYCMHNGINDIRDRSNDNDSWDFFQHVFRGQCRNGRVFQRFKEELEYRGDGVYFMCNPSREEYYMSGTAFYTLNVHLINDGLVLMNSNDDIHEFGEELVVEKYRRLNAFGLDFYDTEKISIPCEQVVINSDLHNEVEKTMIHIYRDGGKLKSTFAKINGDGYGGSKKKIKYFNSAYDYESEYYKDWNTKHCDW